MLGFGWAVTLGCGFTVTVTVSAAESSVPSLTLRENSSVTLAWPSGTAGAVNAGLDAVALLSVTGAPPGWLQT